MALGPNGFHLSLLGVAAGGGLSVYGWFFERQEASLEKTPLTPPGSLEAGRPAVVTGAASCPAPSTAPVSAKPCAFYRSEVQVLRDRRLSRRDYSRSWDVQSQLDVGGFFVVDKTGKAFVAPAGAKAECLPRTEESREGAGLVDGDTWTQEKRIDIGDSVTVLGTPHTLAELIEHMRSRQGGSTLHPELLEHLLRLQTAGEEFPCFFCDQAPFLLSGEGYEAFKADLESSANAYLSVGLLIFGLSAFVLVASWLGFI